MGNQQSQTTILLEKEDVPMPSGTQSLSSTYSSSASSSSSEEEGNSSSTDPYAEDDEDHAPLNATTTTTSSKDGCYRLPVLFAKKTDPLLMTTLVEDDTPERTKKTADASSCYPSSTSSTTKPTHPSSTVGVRALSFSYCQEPQDDDDDEMDESSSASQNASSSSFLLGCVTSPLSMTSKRTNSWSNLVQLAAESNNQSDLAYTLDEESMEDGAVATPESILTPLRHYWIVTTAALPWMTGTAVNPLLRAAYLSQRNRSLRNTTNTNSNCEDDDDDNEIAESTVTLVLPWLESSDDRLALYGPDWQDATPLDQERYIRTWLSESAALPLEAAAPNEQQQQHGSGSGSGIAIQWYPARYHATLSSIFAMGDLCELIPPTSQQQNMICILEEPEHVNFYRAPGRLSWRDKFPHVIGIVHTNYKAYAMNHYSGLLTGPLVGALSALMVRAYCDKVVKLSPVLQTYAPEKEVVSNVHGIRHAFFTVPAPSKEAIKIYFIGKLLWAKGLDQMLELQACYKKATGSYWEMDIFGSGPQQEEIQRAFLGREYSLHYPKHAQPPPPPPPQNSSSTSSSSTPEKNGRRYWRRFRQPIPATFRGRTDHAKVGTQYKIFVNPSITEVLCTTTAEAIAMNKWVIIPQHASNEFFLQFANCLQYATKHEFVARLQHALAHDPPVPNMGVTAADPAPDPVDRSTLYPALTWQAATSRLIETAYLSQRDARRCERLQTKDKSIQEWHYALGTGTTGDVLRKVLGGGPVAEQSQYQKIQRSSSSTTTLVLLEEEEEDDEDDMATVVAAAS
jgi:hypothetical protein